MLRGVLKMHMHNSIVEAIIADIEERLGMEDTFKDVNSDHMLDIKETWTDIINTELRERLEL